MGRGRLTDVTFLPLVELWRHLASGTRSKCSVSLGQEDVAWAIETGMAALMVDAFDLSQIPESLAERLKAADLWARVHSADSMAAALEIVDGCVGHVPPPTLLKGLSIGPERYPAPHHHRHG